MGENSDNFCTPLNIYQGTLETIFHDQKTVRLVGGPLSWSEMPYFHKGGGGALTNGAKVASERRNERILFKQQ